MHAHILSASQFVCDMIAVPRGARWLTHPRAVSPLPFSGHAQPPESEPASSGADRGPPGGRSVRARYPMRGVNPRFRSEGDGSGREGRELGLELQAVTAGGEREEQRGGAAGQGELERWERTRGAIEGTWAGRRRGSVCARRQEASIFRWYLTWIVNDRWERERRRPVGDNCQ